MQEDEALKALAALSHAKRLAVVRRLVQAGPEGLNAGDLADAIGASPSQMSFHLATLEGSGLVTSTKVARNVIYTSDFARFGDLISFILQDCCGDNPITRSCCGISGQRS